MDQIINTISDNIWILIPLAALTIPIVGILTGVWTSWLKYRYRREALETIKAYAAQGKEPPEAVLAALHRTPRIDPEQLERMGRRWEGWDGDEDDDDRASRRASRRERRRGSWVVRRWTGFAWCAAVAVGFYLAYRYTESGNGFLVVAIIMGCIAGASLLSAIIATILREK